MTYFVELLNAKIIMHVNRILTVNILDFDSLRTVKEISNLPKSNKIQILA